MNKKLNEMLTELTTLADKYGVTVEALLKEKELGAKVDKPFTLAVKFDRLQEMVDFVNETIVLGTTACVWKADSLDAEFFGRGNGNNFVIRDNNCSKGDGLRITDTDGALVGEKKTKSQFRECPRCTHFIPNDDTPGAYPGAVSRLDDSTEICSDCGVEEALLQYQGLLTDWRK
jgi:hypothetical protein